MKHYVLLASVILAFTAKAQSPEKFSYQSVVRDAGNKLLVNAPVGMQIKIRQGSTTGTVVYQETHSLSSNSNGLVTAVIGGGTVVSGTFSGINWALGPYFIEVGLDPAGGTTYSLLTTTQLLSVPYALYAANAGNAANAAKPVQAGQGLSKNGDTLHARTTTALWNANSLQGKSISAVAPSNNQVLKWDGNKWSPAADQTGSLTLIAGNGLNKNGDTIRANSNSAIWNSGFLQGRTVSAANPANKDVLQWNGSNWAPAAISGGGGSSNPVVAGFGLSKSGDTLTAKTGSPLWNASAIQDYSVASGKPTLNDVLQWNGSIWKPSQLLGINVYAGTGMNKVGDTLNALNTNSIWNASRLQGYSVSSNAPSTNDVLKWTGTDWAPGTVSGSGTTISCGTTANSNYTVRGNGSGTWQCTDAVWITSTGYVGIGTTSPSTSFDLTVGTRGLLVNGTTTTSNFAGKVRIGSTTSSTYDLQVDGDAYMTAGLRVGTTTAPASGGIMSNGIIETNQRYIMNSSTTGTGTTVIRTSGGELRPQSSTKFVKDNITDLKFSKEKLFSLRPVSYNLKPALGGDRETGLVAEEVAEFMPELVVYGPERKWKGNTGMAETDANGREILNFNKMVPYSVHYDRLPVYLLSIIKEQEERIKLLEQKVNNLMLH
jgi:hypothetical protein